VNESAIYYTVVMLTAFTVALSMRLIGALLLDAIIILPALIAMLHARVTGGCDLGLHLGWDLFSFRIFPCLMDQDPDKFGYCPACNTCFPYLLLISKSRR
jgi:hypothetical protein